MTRAEMLTTTAEPAAQRVTEHFRARRVRATQVAVLGVATLVAAAAAVLATGPFAMSPAEVVGTLFGGGNADQQLVIQVLRLPRILVAVVAGAAFALAGAIMQGVSRNGLADPGILGVNGGAALAVVALLVFHEVGGGPTWLVSPFLVPGAALIGAAAAGVLIYVLAWRRGVSPTRLLLVGIAVSAGMGAAMLLLILRLQFQTLQMVTIFQAGSVWGSSWAHVLAVTPWVLVLALVVQRRAAMLDVLALGDTTATSLGVAVEQQRRRLLAMAVALAAAGVAVAGGVSFLGLLGPHIARRLVGGSHRRLLPTAAVVGGVLLLGADLVGRSLLAPSEIPAGVVVAAIGAPYFIYLLARTRG